MQVKVPYFVILFMAIMMVLVIIPKLFPIIAGVVAAFFCCLFVMEMLKKDLVQNSKQTEMKKNEIIEGEE